MNKEQWRRAYEPAPESFRYAVQAALDSAGIPYHTKAATPLGRVGGRARANPFQDADTAHDYKIYVRKDDYDRAVQAIQPALRER